MGANAGSTQKQATGGLLTGPLGASVASLDGELSVSLVLEITVANQVLRLHMETSLAEARARLGGGANFGSRGRDWTTAEVAELVPDSAYTLKRRLNREVRLKEIGGVYQKIKEVEGRPVEYGTYLFPEDHLQPFVEAYMKGPASSDTCERRTPRRGAEGDARHPPCSSAVPDDMGSWLEEFDD